jgi:hypothetical protein
MADIKPTPTQEENDLAATGSHVLEKEPDGSPLDPGANPPGSGGQPPESGAPVPVIDSITPLSGPKPDATLTVVGSNFTPNSIVVFDGAEAVTVFGSDTALSAAVHQNTAGTYDVLVRDVNGDSNVVTFRFISGAADEEAETTRARRRR